MGARAYSPEAWRRYYGRPISECACRDTHRVWTRTVSFQVPRSSVSFRAESIGVEKIKRTFGVSWGLFVRASTNIPGDSAQHARESDLVLPESEEDCSHEPGTRADRRGPSRRRKGNTGRRRDRRHSEQ